MLRWLLSLSLPPPRLTVCRSSSLCLRLPSSLFLLHRFVFPKCPTYRLLPSATPLGIPLLFLQTSLHLFCLWQPSLLSDFLSLLLLLLRLRVSLADTSRRGKGSYTRCLGARNSESSSGLSKCLLGIRAPVLIWGVHE